MKEQLTQQDVTLQLEGRWYRLPLAGLADDEFISDEYDLYDLNLPGEFITRATCLYEWLLHENQGDLTDLKKLILRRWELIAFEAFELPEIDWFTPEEADQAEPETFWVLERIGSKCPFYARCYPWEFSKGFGIVTTGYIKKASTWPTLADAEEFMDEYSISLDGKFQAAEHRYREGGAG